MHSTKEGSSAQASGNVTPEEYDLVIIGSGAGAKLSAWTFASRGQRVAVVERKYVGGVVSEYCVPAEQKH